jgi:hypothetical protein
MSSDCSGGQLAGAGGSGGAVLGKFGRRQWRLAGGAAGLVREVRSTVGTTRRAAGVGISSGVGGAARAGACKTHALLALSACPSRARRNATTS